jgi:hypothetical protein
VTNPEVEDLGMQMPLGFAAEIPQTHTEDTQVPQVILVPRQGFVFVFSSCTVETGAGATGGLAGRESTGN